MIGSHVINNKEALDNFIDQINKITEIDELIEILKTLNEKEQSFLCQLKNTQLWLEPESIKIFGTEIYKTDRINRLIKITNALSNLDKERKEVNDQIRTLNGSERINVEVKSNKFKKYN